MNNIEKKKKIPEEFHIFVIFLAITGITLFSTFIDLWYFNFRLKHTRTFFLTSDVLDIW